MTGTLGLASGTTADAMRQAVAAAHQVGTILRKRLSECTVCRSLCAPQPHACSTPRRALQSGGQCCVVVDVNWRRVFWQGDEAAAKSEILEYITQAADILKVTDEVGARIRCCAALHSTGSG